MENTLSTGSLWGNIWSGVYECSSLLDRLPGKKADDSLKLETEAEIRFLRAIFTYYAVRLWGDVPLVDTMKGHGFYDPRVSFDKIYEFILDDLEFAEVNMRDPDTELTSGLRQH